MEKTLIDAIKKSNNIVILTHAYADPDAVSSALTVYGVINENFPNKNVRLNSETVIPQGYEFLKNCGKFSTEDTLQLISKNPPDLVIVVDANSFRNICIEKAAEVRSFLLDQNIRLAIIDHHPDQFKENAAYYINNYASSASEEVYAYFITENGLSGFERIEETVLFGILGDTNRFLYKNNSLHRTFTIVEKLLHSGVLLEDLQNRLDRITYAQGLVIAELLKNIKKVQNYNYTYVSDGFAKKFEATIGTWDDFSDAFYIFVDRYLKTVGTVQWGFAIVPDFSNSKSEYRGAFRAVGDDIDTSIWAKSLGGGGHKLASGFSVYAKNFRSALAKVKSTVMSDAAIKCAS